MPPRTILRAPGTSRFPASKSPLAPRLLARSAHHAEDESALSNLALPFRAHPEGDDAPHSSLREAVCGPALLLLALSALSNSPKRGEETAPSLPLSLVTASPACVDVRLCIGAASFPSGPLELCLEIENCATHPIALSFGSGQNFDFSATRQGETAPFWRWASGRRFPPLLRAGRLDSGQILRFEAVWPDAPVGKWQIAGKVTANGGFEAARVDVEIQ